MILELILIVAIVAIFILIVRRLPDAIREGRGEAPPQAIGNRQRATETPKASLFARWFGAPSKGKSSPTPNPAVSAVTKQEEPTSSVITDESLLTEGDAYLEQGKLKEAERSFLRAVAKNPKNPKLYNRLGAIYLRSRNYSDALQAFEAARDLDDSKASRHYNVALAAWSQGNLARAREAVARAISLDPNAQKYRDLKTQIEEGRAA